MNNSKKLTGVLSAAAMATLIASAISTPVSAKMSSVLLQDSTGKVFEYSYADLKQSFMDGTALYTDFTTLKNSGAKVISYYDDVQKGYVSRQTLINAFLNTPAGVTFNANTAIETATVTPVTDPITEKIVNADGTVGEKPKDTTSVVTVSSVSAINATGVTVNFAALPSAISGATVNVVDPSGNTVAVVAQDLAQGATSATFTFTKVLSTVTPGAWKVNGVTYSVISSDSKLSSLTFDSGIWDKTFDPTTTSYNLSVGSNVSTLSLDAIADGASDSTMMATVNGGSAFVVKSGVASTITLGAAGSSTPVVLTVVAPDGKTTSTYTVTVKRATVNANNDASLSGLTFNAGSALDFKPSTTNYQMIVPNATTTITATPVLADAVNATLTINGKAPAPVDLAVGSNVITINTMAQDGVTTMTYTVTVVRASASASTVNTLNSLNFNVGAPAFTADQAGTVLSSSVANSVTSVSLTPVATNANALVEVKDEAGNAALTVTKSGSTYTVSGLVVGATNIFDIVVTPEDGSAAKTYVVTVTRASATASDLSALTDLQIGTGTSGANATAALGTTISGFKTIQTSYSVNVPYANIDFDAFVAAPVNSTISYKLNGATFTPGTPAILKIGQNTLTINVTAENSVNTTTYTVNINRASQTASSVNTLNSIGFNNGTPTGFTADTAALGQTIAVTVPNATTSVSLTPVATNANATVKVIDKTDGVPLTVTNSGSTYTVSGLVEGNTNVIQIVVTPEDGSAAETYDMTINKVAASANDDAFLTAISNTSNFDKTVTNYTTNVGNATNTITFAAATTTLEDAINASVTLNGKAFSADTTLPLSVGANQFTFVVTAANGTTTKTYTVTVNRAALTASNVNTLNSLTLSNGTLSGFTADSATGASSLTTSLANSVQNLTLTPVTTDSNATVTVTAVDSASPTPNNLTVTKNGGAYTVNSLTEGANVITVTVTPQDASAPTVYKLTATRAAAGAGIVSSLSGLTGLTLDKTFDAATTSYKSYVANGTSSVTLTPALTDTNSTVTVNGKSAATPVPLAIGDNTITIVVTAQDLVHTTTYTVVVNRASSTASDVNTLNSLSITPTTVAPATFDKTVTNYTATVAATTSTVTLTALPTESTETVTITAKNLGADGVLGGTDDTVLTVIKNSDGTYSVTGLATGKNEISVNTTSQNNVTTTGKYIIDVTK